MPLSALQCLWYFPLKTIVKNVFFKFIMDMKWSYQQIESYCYALNRRLGGYGNASRFGRWEEQKLDLVVAPNISHLLSVFSVAVI